MNTKQLERPTYHTALGADDAQKQLQTISVLKQDLAASEEKAANTLSASSGGRFEEAWNSCLLGDAKVVYQKAEWVSGIDSETANLTSLRNCMLQKNVPQLLLEDLQLAVSSQESFVFEKLQIENAAAARASYLKCPWALPSYHSNIDFLQQRKQFEAFRPDAKVSQLSELPPSAKATFPFLNRLCNVSPFELHRGFAESISELWSQSQSEVKVSFSYSSDRQLGNLSYRLRATEALMNYASSQGGQGSPRCEVRQVNGSQVQFSNGCVLTSMTEREIKGKAKLRGDSTQDLSKTAFFYARLIFNSLDLGAHTDEADETGDQEAEHLSKSSRWFKGGNVGLELGQWKGSLTYQSSGQPPEFQLHNEIESLTGSLR